MSSTGFIYHPDYLKHKTGLYHPECPERLVSIVSHLEKVSLMEKLVKIEPYEADRKWLSTVHTPHHIKNLEERCKTMGVVHIDADTIVSPDSYKVTLLAVGGCLKGIDVVMEGQVKSAFCAIRPPGHHATRDRAMGFCLFNNVAIAARYLQQHYKLEKVLIVDFDTHHGNGTQDIFYSDPTVLYCSLHQYPHYPGTGAEDERGSGRGTGFTINIPLRIGSGDEEYMKAMDDVVIPQAMAFKPDFVIISAGFDAHMEDPLSGMNLSEDGYASMTQRILSVAEACSGGRLLSALEGGYNLSSLARSVESHIRALMKA